MDEKRYVVYKHTSPSGKVYIGITCQSVAKRWRNGLGYTGSKYFWNAIQKYGWDNFEHEILQEGLSQDEAKQMEVALIAEYHSNKEGFGYNITAGGDGVAGYKQTPEHIRKRMEKTAAKRRGQPLSEECKRKLSESVSRAKMGHHHSEATKQKLREAMTDEVKQRLIAAQQMPEAKKKKLDAIRKRPPEFWAEKNKCLRKPVAQCDPHTGRVIAVFESARSANEITGTRYQDISNCIRGKQKTAHGYVWKLATEGDFSCLMQSK